MAVIDPKYRRLQELIDADRDKGVTEVSEFTKRMVQSHGGGAEQEDAGAGVMRFSNPLRPHGTGSGGTLKKSGGLPENKGIEVSPFTKKMIAAAEEASLKPRLASLETLRADAVKESENSRDFGEWLKYPVSKTKKISEYDKSIEKLKARIWLTEQRDKYDKLAEKDDFDLLSAADSTRTNDIKPSNLFDNGYWDYNYINDIDGYRAVRNGQGAASGGGNPYGKLRFMTGDEIKNYNYLYNSGDREGAAEYLEYLEYALNERATKNTTAFAAGLAKEHPALASVSSIGTNLLSGMGLIDAGAQNLRKQITEEITGEYSKPIDYNSPGMAASRFTSEVRGTRAQSLADKYGVISIDANEHPVLAKILNGKSWGDLYQLGMSMADSATVAAMRFMGFGAFGTVLLGGAAGTRGMLDALGRGASDDEAIAMGVLNGFFEALFEKVSLDSLFKGDTKNIVLAFLKQGLIIVARLSRQKLC